MRSAAVLAVLLAAPLAGCVAPGDGPSGEGVPLPQPAGRMALRLTSAMALEPAEAGEAASLPYRWAWREWLEATPPPTWAAAPAQAPFIVEEASVTLHFAARQPTVGTQQRPELTAWWGVDGAWVHHAFLDGPDLLLPGEVHEATLPLEVPVGGLVVPAGGRVLLALATYYADSAELASVELLLGGEDPTRLDLAVRPLALPATLEEALLSEGGALQGGQCLGLGAAPLASIAAHPLEVPLDALGLRVALRRTGGEGPPDMDFALFGPDGERAARAQGPGPEEHVVLHAANLDAAGRGAWTLRVYNCTPQSSQYEVEASLLRAA